MCVTTSDTKESNKTPWHAINGVVGDVNVHSVALFPQSLRQFLRDLRYIVQVIDHTTNEIPGMLDGGSFQTNKPAMGATPLPYPEEVHSTKYYTDLYLHWDLTIETF